MTEDPLNSCPDCSGQVKKLVSKSSFQLKGGGWYADGYSVKSSNGSGSASIDKSTKSTSNSTKGTSTESKSSAGSSSDSSGTTKSKAKCSAPA